MMKNDDSRAPDVADPDALSKYGRRWRLKVLTRAAEISRELEGAGYLAESRDSIDSGDDLAAASSCLADAMRLAGRNDLRARLRNAISGSDVQGAWCALHDAEQAVVMRADADVVRATLPQVRGSLLATLPGNDPRLPIYLKALDGADADIDGHRQEIRAIQAAIFDAADAAYDRDRTIRNRIAAVAVAMSCVLLGIAITSQLSPDVLQICKGVASAARCAGRVTAGQLELAGSVGGILVAGSSLISLLIGLPGPLGLPTWQALLRAPTGAAAGLLGGIVVQSRLVSLFVPQDQITLLAYAGLFGVAAAFVMRPLDRSLASLRRVGAAPDRSATEAMPAVLDSSVRSAVRAAFAGPALVNFEGWLGVSVAGPRGQQASISDNREVHLQPLTQYTLTAEISTRRPGGTAAPLRITGGVEAPAAEFSVLLDSDDPSLRQPAQVLSVRTGGGAARASFSFQSSAIEPPPWLWIRVAQRDRVVQHMELVVTPGSSAPR